MQPVISIVIPIYNEAGILPELLRRLHAVITAHTQYEWQVIMVNDGSADQSEALLREAIETHPWLTVLHLSRNFGHQKAISAGMDYATGNAVIVMDGDLQDPPEVIPELITKWQSGFEVIYATRETRVGETPFKLITASLFYRLLQKLSDVYIPLDTGDFRLMDRKVLNALVSMRERNRFILGMVSWIGFRQTALFYQRAERPGGKSKYTLNRMLRFAIDGLLSFSTVPLQLISTLGYIISLASFLTIAVVILIRVLTPWHVQEGWASLMAVLLLLGGIQLVAIGVIGEYLGRIYDEVRQRPLYLIRRIDGRLNGQFDTESRQSPASQELALYIKR